MIRPAPISLKEGRTLFGRDTLAYQEGRPPYPLRVYALLNEHCGAETYNRVFEIGPGTGLATEHLLDMGYRVSAIEPDPMLAIKLKERLKRHSPDTFTILNFPFEETMLPAGEFDLGVAATSFHWIDPAKGLEEAWRLLRSGGWFVMWWTVFGDPNNKDAFMQKTSHLFAPLSTSPSNPAGYRHPYSLQKSDRINDLTTAGFTDVISETFNWELEMDAKQTTQLVTTFSPVARLSAKKRAAFTSEVARIVNDDFGGTVKRNFITAIYLARKY
ncbi:TPA: class I SAM-dependent methyltransferase [Salmonella enterica subsp. salamae serovar 28:r:e,n,z15]|nr:class I SAM-dependent methyltransferase [Salmonella enterica subsp. salamae serovar 28:r:e,n,z15]